MIHALTYRPRRLEFEGCQPLFALGIIAALACHKGEASQAQTSTSLGAQTGGLVVSGTTITQDAVGRGGGTNVVNFNTDANMPAAIEALNGALTAAKTANEQTAALAQSSIDSSTGFSTGLQKIASWVSILAGLYLGWKILYKKNA